MCYHSDGVEISSSTVLCAGGHASVKILIWASAPPSMFTFVYPLHAKRTDDVTFCDALFDFDDDG